MSDFASSSSRAYPSLRTAEPGMGRKAQIMKHLRALAREGASPHAMRRAIGNARIALGEGTEGRLAWRLSSAIAEAEEVLRASE